MNKFLANILFLQIIVFSGKIYGAETFKKCNDWINKSLTLKGLGNDLHGKRLLKFNIKI